MELIDPLQPELPATGDYFWPTFSRPQTPTPSAPAPFLDEALPVASL